MSAWRKHLEYFVQGTEYRELHDRTGHPVQFDWRHYPGHTTTKIFQEIEKIMMGVSRKDHVHKHVQTTSSGGPSRTNQNAHRTRLRSQIMLEMSRVVVSFLGPRDEETCNGTSNDKPKGKWNDSAYKMIN